MTDDGQDQGPAVAHEAVRRTDLPLADSRTPVLTACVLGVLTVVLAIALSPWDFLFGGPDVAPGDWARYVSRPERIAVVADGARAVADLAGLLGALLAMAFLARVLGGSARPRPAWLGSRVSASIVAAAATMLVGAAAFLVVASVVRLALGTGSEAESWVEWLSGLGRLAALAAILVGAISVVPLIAAARPRTWWRWTAVALAAVVTVSLVAYPALVQPRVLGLEQTPWSTAPASVSALVDSRPDPPPLMITEQIGAPYAAASGAGRWGRIVLDRDLLELGEERAALVIAHEMRHLDAWHSTRSGIVLMVGLAAAVAALAAVGATRRPQRGGWLAPASSVAAVPWMAAVALVLLVVGTVLGQGMSRAMELDADLAALVATRDPQAFIALQREIGAQSPEEIDPPWVSQVWRSHPTVLERIALAREWATQEGLAIASDVAIN